MAKQLWKGNEAVAEGAIRGGCNFYAGYPITPSTEVMEYLSWRMPEVDRVFIQAESELAAINMMIGASVCGSRVLTATSGPGGALMTEGMSYASRSLIPFVVLNVQRWGTGLGTLDSGQTDYFKDTKGPGHGDFRNIVFAPASIQELVDTAYEAWDVAERYRIGVTILSEGYLGQMMEEVEIPPFKAIHKRDWEIDGSGKASPGSVSHMENVDIQKKTLEKICLEMQRWEDYCLEDADFVLVAFGLPGRVSIDAVKKMRKQGIKAGMIRPKTIWPYPIDAFVKINPHVKGLISVESTDNGMMVEDVALCAKKLKLNVPVYCYPHGKGVPGVGVVIDFYRSVENGSIKERF